MKLEKMDMLPKRNRSGRKAKKLMRERIEQIMALKTKLCKVEFDKSEYVCVHSAKYALNEHVNTYGYPLKFVTINGELYAIRRDL